MNSPSQKYSTADRFHTAFVVPHQSGKIQSLRYFFVGGVSFAVDFSILWMLKDSFGLNYLLAAAAAFSAGLIVNYLISISWVFNRRNINNQFAEFSIFTAIGVVGLFLTELGMWALTDGLNAHYLLSKIVVTGIVYFWNFGIRKIVLFK